MKRGESNLSGCTSNESLADGDRYVVAPAAGCGRSLFTSADTKSGISPNGYLPVNIGTDKFFTVTPDAGVMWPMCW